MTDLDGTIALVAIVLLVAQCLCLLFGTRR
jgi:hypothetical protein